MSQTPTSLHNLVDRISMEGFSFKVETCITWPGSTVSHLRVGVEDGKCNRTGEPMEWWGRKWLLSYHMTDGEVVGTAFKALITALEHEARERFLFDGVPVFDSHVDIHKLVELHRDGHAGAPQERPHSGATAAEEPQAYHHYLGNQLAC